MSQLWLLPSGALAAALLAPPLHRMAPSTARWMLSAVPAVMFAWLAGQLSRVAAGDVLSYSRSWVDALGLTFSLRLDGLALLLALLVTGVGALILAYSGGYLDRDPRLGELYADLLVFMAAMLGLVLADNLLLLFLFWELTSVTSYLLISLDREREAARAAARKALLVTALGGVAMLGGFLLLGSIAGTYDLAALLTDAELSDGPLLRAAVALVLVGALSKSAQMPFHFWLPRAMEAPAPVSAYLHSSTMVVAGVYLLARLQPALSASVLWTPVLVASGGASFFAGGLMAYRATYLKKQLAYSTISALGIMVLLLGIGSRLAVKGAVVFLFVHALYKSSLFLTVGSFTQATGATGSEALRGVARRLPAGALAGALAALSMAGIPPAAGFIAKEVVFDGLWETEPLGALVAGAAVVPVALLVAVSLLVGFTPFLSRPDSEHPVVTGSSPDAGMLVAPMILAVAGIVLGVTPGMWGPALVDPAVGSVLGGIVPLELVFWHGFTPPFILDAVAVAAGVIVFRARSRILGFVSGGQVLSGLAPEVLYEKGLHALQDAATVVSRRMWGGTLGDQVAVIGLVLLGATLPLLASSGLLGVSALNGPEAGVVDGVVVGLILVGAAGTVLNRFTAGAIVSLGLAGFGVTLVFVRFGAPDLALTQVIVETLTMVLLVVAFLRIPDGPPKPRRGGARRLLGFGLPLGIGLAMALFTVAAAGARPESRVASFFVAEAVEQGRGRNLVNVILTDFRSLDTFGEITVVAVAALGAYALLQGAGRSP